MFSSVFILCPDVAHWEKVHRNLLWLQQVNLGDGQVIYRFFCEDKNEGVAFSSVLLLVPRTSGSFPKV